LLSNITLKVKGGLLPAGEVQARRAEGPPALHAAGAPTYTRVFEHASVFVDLRNRTASRVDFANFPAD
jgi:hypothetical protein